MGWGLSRRIYDFLHTIIWRLRNSRRRQIIVGSLTLIVLVVSVMITGAKPHLAPPKITTVRSPVVTTSTNHLSEAPITATYHSAATGDQPEYIDMPTIHTAGYIQAVGIDQRHQIAVPTNIHLAGWLSRSATPGDLGLSIIDGHLDGYRLPGIFANLAQLKVGDHFSVTLANGSRRNFRVFAVQSLPLDQAASVLFSQATSTAHGLNLITCSGEFNASIGYGHRVVVSSGTAE